jgi:error-prone DNA polymerase
MESNTQEPRAKSYTELHCKTNFSFLEGASFPDELVDRAAELGLSALAVTDRNSLAGVVKAHTAAKERNLKLLIGAEIRPTDAAPILLYPTDRRAYANLSELITVGRRRAEKGECSLTAADIAAHAEGLIGVVLPSSPSPNVISPPSPLPVDREGETKGMIYREAFPSRLYVAAELHLSHDDAGQLTAAQTLARKLHAPLVATNDVHYHISDRRYLQDVLVCIREGCTIYEAGSRLFPNSERRIKTAAEMDALFAAFAAVLAPEPYEALLERTGEIASRCNFSLDELRYEYPDELTPPGMSLSDYLNQMTWEGARKFWPNGVPEKVRRQIEHELNLIAELKYEAYFLTVWDLVVFARSRGILCQGRGSAANSAVCYALGITSVDPARSDVLFERFVSRERAEAPDIDVDFEHERREEVMQYVYTKYGRDHAGIVAEVICYRPKSAVRDVGKALGLSLDRIDQLAGVLDRYDSGDKISDRLSESGLDAGEGTTRHLVRLSRELLGFPRHLSQHVGGFVITRGQLSELVPIENATMPGRTVIEWDKDDIDALGILKVDCLALGMLTCIHRCFELINSDVARAEYIPNTWLSQRRKDAEGENGDARSLNSMLPVRDSVLSPQSSVLPVRPRELTDIPAEDPDVYEMSSRADTIGVFQIESRAQMSMLPRLKPRCFYDLVIEVSIVRPGPIQGGMVHPYLKRRAGEEAVTFPSEAIRDVLQKTLGVPLFQEQVMRLAMVAGGFSPGEADQLRRAMGAWRRPGLIDRLRDKLLSGMLANGYPKEYAEQIFEQIRGFGEYGFPESHAASFALLVYASAWLKLY